MSGLPSSVVLTTGAPESLNIARRFFKRDSLAELVPQVDSSVSNTLADLLSLGLLVYGSLYSNPTRGQKVPEDDLLRHWVSLSLVADQIMRPFNETLADIPDNIYKRYCDLHISEKLRREWRCGVWKRSKLGTYLHNVYCAGSLLSYVSRYDHYISRTVEKAWRSRCEASKH